MSRRHRSSTLPVAVLLALGAFFLEHFVLRLPLGRSALFALVVLYLPFYFDRSELDPNNSRLRFTFQSLPQWRQLTSYLQPEFRFANDRAIEQVRTKQIILSVHPHGVMTCNHFLLMTDACGILSQHLTHPRRDIAASILFKLPLLRDLLLALGCLDASPSVCHKILSAGMSLQLYCGGEQEQLLNNHRQPIIFVSKRKGFIKLAARYSVPIVPVYVFNEDRLYYTSTFLLSIRLTIARALRIAIPLAFGRWWCPLVPLRKPLVVCVGSPIDVKHKNVDQIHEDYCRAMLQLFDDNKRTVEGYENSSLQLK